MNSQYTLLLGFSYSLAPDGSPGSYNRDIAAAMCQWIAQRAGVVDDLLLAAQWEIVDALKSQQADLQPFVASPPTIAASDVLDAERLVGLLRAGDTAGARKLSQLLCASLRRVGYESDGDDDAKIFDRAGLNPERLAMYLNGLLPDPTMYQRFRPNVELRGPRFRGTRNASWRRSASPVSDNPRQPVDYRGCHSIRGRLEARHLSEYRRRSRSCAGAFQR